ncbi:transposase [Kitasatospora sp. NPDC057692]|uniref:transposase n=1 Tax=Kitasatospora sp. NPDC057692 TaxID=3346215 RepID=UPI0036CD03A2
MQRWSDRCPVGADRAAAAGEQRAVRPVAESPTMVNGVSHRIRTDFPWRDLPERYGPWKTAHERHRRWSADGTWQMLLHRIQAQEDTAGTRTRSSARDRQDSTPRKRPTPFFRGRVRPGTDPDENPPHLAWRS